MAQVKGEVWVATEGGVEGLLKPLHNRHFERVSEFEVEALPIGSVMLVQEGEKPTRAFMYLGIAWSNLTEQLSPQIEDGYLFK